MIVLEGRGATYKRKTTSPLDVIMNWEHFFQMTGVTRTLLQ
jgi:hypothetical protein